MSENYYDILGLSKDADAQAIEIAWKRIRSKLHPDREGGDKVKFQEAKDAYDVLSDARKRSTYDQFGTTSTSGPQPGYSSSTGDASIDDLLRRMRESRNGDFNSSRGETIQKVQIPVDIMINGGRATFRFMVQHQNAANLMFQYSVATTTLKPETKVGQRITVKEVPNTTFILLPGGSSRCAVQGLDLVVPFEVNALAAAVGNKCKVLHPNGKSYDVQVPPGSKNGTALRLPGMGLQHVSGARGNLLAVINYAVPVLSKKDQNALRKLLDSA